MPSFEHELLVALLREHPDLVVSLLRFAFGPDAPFDLEVAPASENLTDLQPAEYRADLVVVLRSPGDPRPRRALVIEVQLRPDAAKRLTWPVYVAVARARLRCPVTLVVIALDATTARWCAAPIPLDDNASELRPLVLGPGRVPIVDAETARRHPELAVLSLLAHRDEASALQIGRAVLAACEHLDPDSAAFYADIVMGFVNEAARRVLEAEMHLENYEPRSEFLRNLKDRGRVEAFGRAVLKVLEARGLPVTAAQSVAITGCDDLDMLETWLARAVTASHTDDLFAG